MVKNLFAMQEMWVRSLGQEDPLEKEMATHSGFLPGKSHGQRSLVGYSPWGHKESDTTERLTHMRSCTHTHTHLKCIFTGLDRCWGTWFLALRSSSATGKDIKKIH